MTALIKMSLFHSLIVSVLSFGTHCNLSGSCKHCKETFRVKKDGASFIYRVLQSKCLKSKTSTDFYTLQNKVNFDFHINQGYNKSIWSTISLKKQDSLFQPLILFYTQ